MSQALKNLLDLLDLEKLKKGSIAGRVKILAYVKFLAVRWLVKRSMPRNKRCL